MMGADSDHIQPGGRPMSRFLVFLLIAARSVSGQTTGGATVRGSVVDSTGAIVAGAKVSATNVQTSFVYEGVTSTEGAYYIPYVNPGEYRVTVEAPGFKKF